MSDATASVPYSLVISPLFKRRRGLALGLAVVGLAMGSIVMPQVAQQMIAAHGSRDAFAFAGGAVLIIAMPAVGLFLKDAPRELRLQPDRMAGEAAGFTWHEIRVTPSYWLMIAAFVLAGASINACIVQAAQFFSDRGGMGAAAAALSVGELAMAGVRCGPAPDGSGLD